MAEANWLRKTPPAAELSEDPFAELTRIMGFDPRVPFRNTRQPEAPQQVAAAPKVDVSDEDLDFSLDLEHELIGAFVPEVESLAPSVSHAASQPMALNASFPDDLHPANAVSVPQVPALDEEAYGAVEVPAQAVESLPSADDMEWDVDEAAFADYVAEEEPAEIGRPEEYLDAEPHRRADAGDELVEADETYAAQHESFFQEDDHVDAVDARHIDAGVPADAGGFEEAELDRWVAAAAPESAEETGRDESYDTDHAAALAVELDEVLSVGFEDDAAYGDGWLTDGEPERQAPQPDNAEMQPFAPLPADHFATEFDQAMAEVDMDFTSAAPALPEAAWNVPPSARDDAGDLQPRDAGSTVQNADDETSYDDSSAAGMHADAYAFADDDSDSYNAESEPLEGAEAEPPAFAEPAQQHDYTADAHDVTQSEIDDAIAELAAMVRGYDQPRAASDAAAIDDDVFATTADADDFLEIETVDVPEGAVALADDLDIPDIDYAQDSAPVFDDLDAELAAAFGEPAMETVQLAQPAASFQPDFDLDDGYDRDAAGLGGFGAAALTGAAAGYQAAALRGRPGDVQVVRRDMAGTYEQGDFEVEADPEPEDELAAAEAMGASRRSPARRGLVVASVVGGIAVAGVIGAFAFSGGETIGSGAPALVKADTDPVKVRPENPGGTVVANQTSDVFDRAAGEAPAQPAQQALISTQEDPVDVAARFPEPEPIDESADIESLAEAPEKSADRIDPAVAGIARAEEEGTVAVPPRKVRTMIVKPDGTLVPREEVVADQPATVGSTTAAGSLTDPAVSAPEAQDDFSGVDGAAASPPTGGEAPAAAATDTNQAAAEASTPAAAASGNVPSAVGNRNESVASAMPDSVPVAPSRPADQPLDIVGEVKPGQVASLDPQAGTVPAGTWSMQIASQPTEAAAQASYKDLSRRYAGVLGGRSANIVKAEIAGKGTFWRVRVPAGSRNEAVELCESYKMAGGNCFVSK